LTEIQGILAEAFKESKSNNHKEALRLYKQALDEEPENSKFQTNVAWELFHNIKSSVQQEAYDSAVNYLREYAKLNLIEKPSQLHSILLSFGSRIYDHFPNYLKFVKWWDLDNLRTEDYQPFGDMPYSLAEQTIMHVSKIIYKSHSINEATWILPHLTNVSNMHQDNIWLKYRMGQMLVLLNKRKEAQEIFIPIVREKSSEWWAWDVLAQTFNDESREKSIACLIKAACSCVDETFIINVKARLAKLLAEFNKYNEAKFECKDLIRIKEGKIPQDLIPLVSASWYQNASDLENNNLIYDYYLPLAESIIFEALPKEDANIIAYSYDDDKEIKKCIVGFYHDNKWLEIPVEYKKFSILRKQELGDTISLKFFQNDGIKIVDIQNREGEKWDILTEHTGIIDHVNSDKGISHIVISKSEGVLAFHNRTPHIRDFQIGKCLKLKYLRHDDRKGVVVWIRPLEDGLSTDYHLHFSGVFSLPHKYISDNEEDNENLFAESFGFVEDIKLHTRVFIPPNLVIGNHICHGSEINGDAIYSPDKKGWAAYVIDNVEIR